MKHFILSLSLVALVSAKAAAQDSLLFVQPVPGAAAGSSQAIDDIRKDYRIHLGPFYLNPQALLKELGVDSNVFNQATGQEQSDFTFTLTPRADIAVPIARRALFKTALDLDAVYYQHFSSERSLDPQAVARLETYASRITFFAQESYLNTRQRPNYEIDLRLRHLENDFGAGASVKVTPKMSVELAGLSSRVRFSSADFIGSQSLAQTLNRDSTGFSVTGREKLTPLTTLAVRYEQLHDSFPLFSARDGDSFRIMPGVEFKPRALISGSAFVGYRDVTPVTASVFPEFSGAVANVSLSYTLLGSTVFGVTYDRDLQYSYDAAFPYYIDNSPGVYVRRQIGGRFDLIGNAATHAYTYTQQGVAQSSTPRVDTTNNYGVNLGYRMKRETRVGFGFSYYTRRSNAANLPQYNGLRLGTTVTYGF